MLDCDIAVIGAGIAGLACARELVRAGDRVVVLEKSRGVGGRVATRRLHETCADHGTCYLKPKGDQFQAWLQTLADAGVIQVWTDRVHEVTAGALRVSDNRAPRYAAPLGMTAIAKVLAEGLDVQLGQRVEQLDLIEPSHWQLTIAPASEEEPVKTLTAKTVVMAIPAPQALVLLEKVRSWLPPDFVQQVAAVQFAPCLSVMAGYNPACAADWLRQYPDVKAITLSEHPELAYLGYDSSKRETPAQPVFVMQSSAVFADRYLDAGDLQPAAHQLLQAAAAFAPWLASPEWMQVHRWRYAFAQSPLPTPYLATQAAKLSPPLVCTGDWCGGATVEAAFLAGLATAAFLKGSTLPSSNAL